ncbi:MAG: acyl-ACP--UDP-N-acetylglucosamine O-acyltransferase [Kiritimatiellia bacterium]
METTVHPAAVVEDGVVLGDGVRVGPFSYIRAGAQIGAGCTIGSHVTIHGCVTLGKNCQVHAGAVLGDLPQDLGFEGEASFVRIGDDCVLREGVTIHRGTKPGTTTVIGNRCMFMANSHAAHNVETGDDVILANGALLGGYVKVGARVFISGNALVHQFVQIGDVAMLGGGSAVSKDVPPYCTVRSQSLNRVVGLNIVGLRRAGIGAAERAAIKRVFKTIYLGGMGVRDALAVLQAEDLSGMPAAEAFIRFVKSSQRGICGYARGVSQQQDDEG